MLVAISGDYMIPVGRDEILSRFVGIPAVLEILRKLYLAITCKKFHPGKTGSICYTAKIPLCWHEVFPCNPFSRPKGNGKIN